MSLIESVLSNSKGKNADLAYDSRFMLRSHLNDLLILYQVRRALRK